jgi:hypothetical protein
MNIQNDLRRAENSRDVMPKRGSFEVLTTFEIPPVLPPYTDFEPRPLKGFDKASSLP